MTTDLAKIYMHTSNGRKYYPFAPKSDDVDINVIAHHLATRARWAGATQHQLVEDRIFYSVAEHSVYVADYVEFELKRPDLALAALLHDGAESYNGDLIRPLKYSPEFSEPFKRVESMNEAAVEKRFGIEIQMQDPAIKVGDDAVCYAEWLQIIPRDLGQGEWKGNFLAEKPAKVEIAMFQPFTAKKLFLKRYEGIVRRMRQEARAEVA